MGAINDKKNKRLEVFGMWCWRPDTKDKLDKEKKNEEELSSPR